ncbi:MAG: PaaI family thioesterase [Polyangiales bacterium]
MPTNYERMQNANLSAIEAPPVAKLVGFDLVELGNGRSVMSFAASARHANPMGTLHGGILCDVADGAMGAAFWSTLEPTESFTTLELKINFFIPVWEAKLRAVATVVRRGQTVGMVECNVTDEADRLVARASSTCMVLRGKQAGGR